MKAKAQFLESGLATSLQDLGRVGYAKYGVPRSGVMDQKAYFLANALLGNMENSPVLEWAMVPPKLHFSEPTIVVCTGAIVIPKINGEPKKMYQQLMVPAGGIMTFNFVGKGLYGYIAVKDGFCGEKILGSKSMFAPITEQSVFKKNDHLRYVKSNYVGDNNAILKYEEDYFDQGCLEVFPGPEFELLSEDAKKSLTENQFTISGIKSRMGVQLVERLVNGIPEILTGPVLPGTVQLTSSGSLIVLMRDCQVTGGYPRVLQLCDDAINILSQKITGKKIVFNLIK